jgi:hypothetical protein
MDKRIEKEVKRVEEIFEKNNYTRDEKLLFIRDRLKYTNNEIVVKSCEILLKKVGEL